MTTETQFGGDHQQMTKIVAEVVADLERMKYEPYSFETLRTLVTSSRKRLEDAMQFHGSDPRLR